MTTKNYSFVLGLLFVVCCLPEVQSQEQEERLLTEPYTEISAESGIDVFLTQGELAQVLVEADKSVLDKIVTRVEGNVLKIYIRNNLRWVRSQSLKVYVTMKEIKGLSISGGADLRTTAAITTAQLTVNCSGGGDAYIAVKANHVELYASGGADIDIKGETQTLKADASGGADIVARELKAQRVVAEASGGADIEVYAGEEIQANATGGGDIDYYGLPVKKSINKSGGGDVSEKR
jgi:hypothetical protein